ENPGADVNPDESQVPLQSAAQPATQRVCLGPMQKIFLRNLCAKAGERPKNLQPTEYQYQQRDRIHPVTQAHDERMLVYRLTDRPCLYVRDCGYLSRHVTCSSSVPLCVLCG